MSLLLCSGSPVLSVCPVWTIQTPFQATLSNLMSQLSYSYYTAPAVLSCHSYPVLVILSQLSYNGFSFQVVLSLLPGYGHPLRSVLFRLMWPAHLPDRPVPAFVWVVLSQLSCPGCPVMASCQGYPVSAVLSQLFCAVMFWLSCNLFPVVAVLPLLPTPLSSPAVLSWLSCPGCPVPDALY
jgi:hypothetical protein